MEDPETAALMLGAQADLVTPMAIRVAATLRVADHIAAGMRTAPEIAARCGAHPVALERVLRHLVNAGVFTGAGDGAYGLTPRGEALCGDGVRSYLDIDGGVGRGELAFVQLLHCVRTGEAGYPAQFGATFWDDLAADPARNAVYDAEMAGDVTAWAPAVIGAYDWGALGNLVDVGGGNGALLCALLGAFPALRGTVFDQPSVAARARAQFAAAGLSERADAIGGSFFDALPAGAAAYLLAAIVHDWDDEPARRILERCRDGAGTGGRVFVIEKIGHDGVTPNTLMDLRLLVLMGGRERTRAELGALVESAGLRVDASHDAGAIVILECRST